MNCLCAWSNLSPQSDIVRVINRRRNDPATIRELIDRAFVFSGFASTGKAQRLNEARTVTAAVVRDHGLLVQVRGTA